MSINKDIALEIKEIFDKNTLSDLKRFLHKRERLNYANSYLMYLFYLVQSAGILSASIGAGYSDVYLLWSGIGLNALASLIITYEKLNNSIMKKLMHDIKDIRDGKYIDELEIIDPDQKSEHGNTNYNEPIPIPIPIPNVNTPLLININSPTHNANLTNI
jgi:hypothetical protein